MRYPRLQSTAALALVLVACSSGGDDNAIAPVPILAIACSGAAPAGADEVALDCPAGSVGLITVAVVIGGPTGSSEIYGIAFDLVFDGALLEFQPPAVEGVFLDQDGQATSLLANPDPVDADRVIVALTRLGPVGGVGAGAGTQPVVTVLFRALAPGTTALRFENSSVVDPSGAAIPLAFTAPLTLNLS